ncbi:MAG: SdrD B-like domain-containing protein, partial [Anaerolineae bacterium]
INEAGTGYTLTASAAGLTGDTSSAFNISPAAPVQLAFVQQPTNALINTTIAPAVTVQITDSYGNPVPLGGQPITLAIGTNPGGGTLGGTTTQVSSGAGLATFNNLSINQVGVGYTLTASAPGLTGTTSTVFNISFAAVDRVTFVQQPTNTAAGNTITPAVTVAVRDTLNNVITTDNSTQITLAIGTNPVGGTLNGTLTQTVVNGVATFNDLSINEAGVGYTLTASSIGLTGDTSSAFNISPAAPVQLAFVQQPTNALINTTIAPAVTIQIVDAYGNAVPLGGQPITLAIGTNPGGGTLGGTTTQVSSGAGLATFNNLSINQVGVGYTLTASAPGLTGTTSSAFNISFAAADHLTFLQQPTNTAAGNTITPAVTVEVRDTLNNVITTDNSTQITLAIGTNPVGGTLNGTLTLTVVNGVATFNNLSINEAGVGYTLTASAAGLTGATSNAFNISPAAPTQLLFVQQPSNTVVNSTISPAVTVQIVDVYGNTVPLGGQPITLAIGTNPSGGTLGGTTTQVSDGTGLATFNNLSIDQVGVGYTLTASAPGLTGAPSTAFNITAGAPSQLAFVQQPTNTVAGNTITPAVTVEVRDTFNNVVTGDNSTQITLAIGTNPSSGTLNGTLTQTVVNGVATFNNLSINEAGVGYTLTASAAGLTGATSSSFDITAGAAAALNFVQQPTNTTVNGIITPSVTVQVVDAFNNTVAAGGTSITLAIGTNPSGGTLGGTLTQATDGTGLATFNDLTIDQVGVGYTLTASAAGLTGTTSTAFNIIAGVPSQIAFNVQPSTTNIGGTITPAVTVEVRDSLNNVITTDNSTQITLAIGTNPGGGTLSGTLTQTVVNGVATFANLSINQVGTGYTLVASASGFSNVTSNPFDITNLPPTQLAFAQQPTNTLVNTAIVPSITVELRNVLNAVVTTDNTTQVTIAIGSNPGVGALGGTLTQTAVNGIATFPGLSIDQVGVGYTLTASAPGLTGATSSTFDIFTVPNDTIVGVVFNDLDGNGTQDPGDTNMSGVTVYLDTNNNGSLDGGETSTVTDASGAYSFTSLAAGSYNVRIVPSASFSVTTTQPAVVVVPQAPIVSIAIGQHAVVVPTSVPPTQTSGEIPATDPRAWSLTLSANPAFVPPGSTTTLTITLSKLSGGTVVNLSSTLPAGFTIASVSSNRGTASFNGLTISFTDDMHVGDVATIVANLRVPQNSGVWTVTGCVTSPASLCAQTTITSVNNLPATGEGMPEVLRYVLLLGGAGVLALAAVSVFAKRNMKR